MTRTFALTGVAGPVGDGPAPTPDCREDLITVDGTPLPVRLVPSGNSLRVDACGPLTLAGRSHQIMAAPGSVTGINIDRLVLSSGSDGGPAAVGPRGTSASDAGATVSVANDGSSALDLDVRTDGEPFWLVLAQGNSEGWRATIDGGSIGDRQLVDGYANGWLVTPDGPGTFAIKLRWEPQRLLWAGFAASGLTLVVACLILWRTRGRGPSQVEPSLAATPLLLWRTPWTVAPGIPSVGVSAAIVGLGALAAATPTVAVAALAITLAAGLLPRGRLLLVVAAPAALALSRLDERPSLAWLAVALLAADLLLDPRRSPSASSSELGSGGLRPR